ATRQEKGIVAGALSKQAAERLARIKQEQEEALRVPGYFERVGEEFSEMPGMAKAALENPNPFMGLLEGMNVITKPIGAVVGPAFEPAFRWAAEKITGRPGAEYQEEAEAGGDIAALVAESAVPIPGMVAAKGGALARQIARETAEAEAKALGRRVPVIDPQTVTPVAKNPSAPKTGPGSQVELLDELSRKEVDITDGQAVAQHVLEREGVQNADVTVEVNPDLPISKTEVVRPKFGFTKTSSGQDVTTGYTYSPYKGREARFDHPPTDAEIAAYVEKNQDLLSQEGNHFGGYEDDGTYFLDVVKNTTDQAEAVTQGRIHRQRSAWDHANNSEIDLSYEVEHYSDAPRESILKEKMGTGQEGAEKGRPERRPRSNWYLEGAPVEKRFAGKVRHRSRFGAEDVYDLDADPLGFKEQPQLDMDVHWATDLENRVLDQTGVKGIKINDQILWFDDVPNQKIRVQLEGGGTIGENATRIEHEVGNHVPEKLGLREAPVEDNALITAEGVSKERATFAQPPDSPVGGASPTGVVPEEIRADLIQSGVSKNVVDSAGELFTKGIIKRDPTMLISDQVMDAVSRGQVKMDQLMPILEKHGIGLEEFGRDMLRVTAGEAGRVLQRYSRIQQYLNNAEDNGLGALSRVLDKMNSPLGRLYWRMGAVRDVWRTMLTTLFDTAARNAVSQGVRFGVHAMDLTLESGIQKLMGRKAQAGFHPEKVLSPLDGLKSFLDLFHPIKNSKLADALVNAEPAIGDRLFTSYNSDISTKLATHLRNPIDKGLVLAQKGAGILNWANQANEYMFRRAALASGLSRRFSKLGKNVTKMIEDGSIAAEFNTPVGKR
ncbi:MAG: hypothetical protein L0170_18435, partial [Acidobacteria bacterium]|nr:hypothetical protein [Acidobacteriota bacterium]